VRTIAAGDVDGLRALLDQHPELVRVRTAPPARATLLHFRSFNGFDEVSDDAPASTPDLARLLIRRDAEPDATAFAYEKALTAPIRATG
jgi:hypothetical protein